MSPTVPAQVVEQLAAGVARCPSVARLSGGLGGTVATYLPGRRVTGVVIRDGDQPEVQIHVVARYGPTAGQVAEEIDQAVRVLLPTHRVQVSIDDLDIDPRTGRSATDRAAGP